MVQVRSTGYGWGVLMVAGAGAYYFAKKSINEDKAERQEKEIKRRMLASRMEARERVDSRAQSEAQTASNDHISGPRREANRDPSPSSHPTSTPPVERGKYAPAEAYVSRKGDRFS